MKIAKNKNILPLIQKVFLLPCKILMFKNNLKTFKKKWEKDRIIFLNK